MSKDDKKVEEKEVKKLFLTDKEKEEISNIEEGKEEVVKQILINKAILDVAEGHKFEDREHDEIDYFLHNEKAKFFLAKKIEDKIDISDDEITRLYTENKESFDAQGIQFSEARDMIQQQLLNQQIATLEAEELNKLIDEMDDKLEITKKEILFSQGNPEVLKSLIVGKIVEKKMISEDFEKKEEENIKIIEGNVLLNYYLDLQVRKNVKVTQEEVAAVYENEKAKLGNITPNDAYNQIANGLLNNKAIAERQAIIDKIANDYKIEDLVKENL